MNIIHVYSSLNLSFGGPPRSVHGVSYALAGLGHHVVIVASGTDGWAPAALDATFANGGSLRVWDMPRWAAAGKARQLVEATDLVHMHNVWDPLNILLAACCRRVGTPYIISPRGCLNPWSMGTKRAKKQAYLSLVGRRLVSSAAALHLLNTDELDGARRLSLVGRYFILPNGVHPSEWDVLPEPGSYRAAHPGIAGRLIVLDLARLHRVKGPELLLQAFAELSAEFPHACLIMAGADYGMGQQLRSYVDKMGLSSKVFLPGVVSGEERRALLQDADIFALPSHQEGHPMGVVEAAYLGKPLLITPECHCGDLVAGVAAEVVSDDLDGVKTGLARLLGDERYRMAIGREAQRIAREKYTWPRIAAELALLYEAAVHSPTEFAEL